MTVMGKILVFLILALALVQAALHVMFHVTQTNWAKGYQELNLQKQAAQSDAELFRKEREEEKDRGAKEVAKLTTDLGIVSKEKDQLDAKLAEQTKQMETMKTDVTKGTANLGASQVGARRRQEEVKRLEDTLKTRDDKIRELVDSNNSLRDRAVAAEIESKTLKERNGNLVTKLEEVSKEMVKVRNGTSSGGTQAKNPPPENVEGLVTKIDASGLMTLSIGGDDGLLKGHTMEVFRLSPAKYLGTVRIISVTPHEAVAQPTARPLGAIQQGDRVASRILGN